MLNKIIIHSFFTFIFICSSVSAIESDKNEPIYLESDSAKWDEESQKSTYRGNVIVTQGSMLLTGNLLIVSSKNNEINKMVINGEKATYKQKTRNGKIVNGVAKKIECFFKLFTSFNWDSDTVFGKTKSIRAPFKFVIE